MNIAEIQDLLRKYQIDALKTALRTEKSKDLLIRTNGLIGEWGEFLTEPEGLPLVIGMVDGTPTSKGGELADCFWYAAAVCDVVGIQLADLVTSPVSRNYVPERAERVCTIAIAGVCEYAKKVGGHGRNKPVEDLARHLGRALDVLLMFAGDTLPLLLAANIAKLRARHANAGPGGFDPNYGKPARVAEIEGSTAALMRGIGEQLRSNPGCLGAPMPITREDLTAPDNVLGYALEDSKPVPNSNPPVHEVLITTGRASFDGALSVVPRDANGSPVESCKRCNDRGVCDLSCKGPEGGGAY